MESMASMINEGEWSSFSGVYNMNEESSDIMALLNSCSVNFSIDHHIGVDSCWSNNDHDDNTTMDMSNSLNFSDIYNGSSYATSGTNGNYHFSGFSQENGNYYGNDENSHQILGMSSYDEFVCLNTDQTVMGTTSFHVSQTDDMIDVDDCLINEDREHDRVVSEKKLPLHEANVIGKKVNISKNKKRSLNPNVEKNKRNVKSKKNVKLVLSDKTNEEKNEALIRQCSSSCSSEDYFSEITEGMTSTTTNKGSLALNSSGKTRASRGSATDPQSLYARKRRERINERLKVLQNLVPNGTKVDISTMLEEAVQYVKFLQLQIKLLSSDDMWMYAPLAYNGMDIGLDLKINMLNDLRR